MRPHAASRYLALARLLGLNGQANWQENWFYLHNMVLVLPSFMAVRPVGVTLESWWLCPQAEDVVDVPALVGAIEALRGQGLTRLVVVRTFIHRWILPLRERAHPLWLH